MLELLLSLLLRERGVVRGPIFPLLLLLLSTLVIIRFAIFVVSLLPFRCVCVSAFFFCFFFFPSLSVAGFACCGSCWW
jgi:hypothetical protein